MKRPERGRALFYTRDSGGKHEMTPGQYVRWAQRRAVELGLTFDGQESVILALIGSGAPFDGDIYLDFDVCGNLMSRPGLDALRTRVAADHSISHVLIPRRDRLARPDDPIEGVLLETSLRKCGVTVVFMDKILAPLVKGERIDIADVITGVVDYDRAGKDRRDLAQKSIDAQLALARAGFSTGGRPCYGFRRWLVRNDGARVRELVDGERVRMPNHHVVWLPVADDHPEMVTIRRIRSLLKTVPASRIARLLTEECIPSPDAGRRRKDGGVEHYTSGVWHQTSIGNIGRNAMLAAVCTYGRRSMGDQLRFSPTGPRPLGELDFRQDGKPKVIQNLPEVVQRASAHFEPIVELAEHQELQLILDSRAASQRGKPRSRDPNKNPLGCRIFDLNCTWPMYRVPRGASFRYTCGQYAQSHGQHCDHNHVDGPTAAVFALSCLRQKLLSPKLLAKLRLRLRDLANGECVAPAVTGGLAAKRAELEQTQANLAKTERNMALADTPEQYRAVAEVFESLRRQVAEIQGQVAELQAAKNTHPDVDSEVAAAMAVLDRLPALAADPGNLAAIGAAFRVVNLRLFLAFQKRRVKGRKLNKIAHGVVTFGTAPPPVQLYAGATGRRAINGESAAAVAANPGGGVTLPGQFGSGREGNSLGNVSRGDRI